MYVVKTGEKTLDRLSYLGYTVRNQAIQKESEVNYPQMRLKHCHYGDIVVDQQGEKFLVGNKVKSHPTICALLHDNGEAEPHSVEEVVEVILPVQDALLLALSVVEERTYQTRIDKDD